MRHALQPSRPQATATAHRDTKLAHHHPLRGSGLAPHAGRRANKTKARADAQRAFPAVHVRPLDEHFPWKHRFSRHGLRGNTLLVAAHATFGHASVFNRKPRVPQALGRINTFGSFCELSVFFGSPASTVSGGRSTRNHTFGSGDPLDS